MLTAEQLEILDLARDFAAGELAPNAEHWDAAQALPAGLFGTLAEMGFTGMVTPEVHGGLGLEPSGYYPVLAALAHADASPALALASHNAIAQLLSQVDGSAFGDVLSGMAEGSIRAAAAVQEGDLDPVVQDFEVRMAGDRLNGTKSWVVEAASASTFLVVAAEGEGSSAFLVRSGDAVSVSGRRTTMGVRALELSDVTFSDAAVVRVGGAGDGARIMMAWQGHFRATVAAVALGIAQASVDHAVRYSQEREQFGRPLARLDAIQAKMANMEARTVAARGAVSEMGALSGSKEGARAAAAAKLVASEAAMFASDEAVQIFGGYGYMRDYPVEKLMRDAKGTEILGGTSETLRRFLAKELLSGDA